MRPRPPVLVSLLAAAALLLPAACTMHRQLPPLSDAERAAYANDEGFPLVRAGMTTEDVVGLLGPPTSVDSDGTNHVYRYRGRGYITFAPARFLDFPRVIEVQPDPEERGS